jgi:hypothetical protein
MSQLKTLIHEIHRRSLWRVLGICELQPRVETARSRTEQIVRERG